MSAIDETSRFAEKASGATTRASRGRSAIVLGKGLRPIVFGAAMSGSGIVSDGAATYPDIALSVHDNADVQLGFAVVDRATPGATWGGISARCDASLGHAVAAARATSDQLRVFELDYGAHHCVVAVRDEARAPERLDNKRAFLEALEPLVRGGLAQIIYSEDDDRISPAFAHRAAVSSAVAAVLAVLDSLEVEATRATVGILQPTPLALDIAAELENAGLRLVSRGGSSRSFEVDVLLANRVPPLEPQNMAALVARTLVLLEPTSLGVRTESRLCERGVVVIPDTLAVGGRLVGLDLRARGLSERAAERRLRAAVGLTTRNLLARAREASVPLTTAVRWAASSGLGLTALFVFA